MEDDGGYEAEGEAETGRIGGVRPPAHNGQGLIVAEDSASETVKIAAPETFVVYTGMMD